MNIMFFLKRLLRRRANWCIFAAVFAMRLFILFTYCVKITKDDRVPSEFGVIVYPRAMLYHFTCFSSNIMMAVFVPLFCFWLMDVGKIFKEPSLLSRMDGLARVATQLFVFAGVNALAFTLVINVTTLPAMLPVWGQVMGHLPYFIMSFILQLLFFAVCALLYGIVFFLTGREFICFIVVVFYGFLDAIGTFQSWWYNISAVRTDFSDAMGVVHYLLKGTVDFSNLIFLTALLIGLSVVAFYVVIKKDYINKSEDGAVG